MVLLVIEQRSAVQSLDRIGDPNGHETQESPIEADSDDDFEDRLSN
jgi:hypothetical protein